MFQLKIMGGSVKNVQMVNRNSVTDAIKTEIFV